MRKEELTSGAKAQFIFRRVSGTSGTRALPWTIAKGPVSAGRSPIGIAVRMKAKMLVAVVLLCTLGAAQTGAPKPAKDQRKAAPKAPIPVYEIALSEDDDYQPLPYPKNYGARVGGYCNGDGNLYKKSEAGSASLTPNGIVSFLNANITDVVRPRADLRPDVVIFASGVSFLVTGTDDTKVETTTWTDDEGHKHIARDATNATTHYIARFGKDGTYKSAIKLDLPFVVEQFAAFDSGNLIAQGPDQNNVPRVALLDASAQFLRYLDLRNDISTLQNMSAEDVKCDECKGNISYIVSETHFTPWHGKMLMFRPLTSSPQIYEIQEGGEVRVVKVKAPEEYDIGPLVPTDGNWLVRFDRPDLEEKDRAYGWNSLLEVDPQTGEPLRAYRVKPPDKLPETMVACFFDGEFWGLRQDRKEEKLKVVRGTATPYQGK